MMKKFTFLFYLCCFGFVANAQITIPATGNVINVGDQITQYKVGNAATVNLGVSGANAVWDMSAELESGVTEVYNYLPPAGLPTTSIEALMTGADMAEQLNGQTTGYFYFDNNVGTEWNRSGFYADDGSIKMWIGYPTPLKLYQYPITYGDIYVIDPFQGAGGYDMGALGQDQAIIPNTAAYNYSVDGYGTLILPHQVYPNALRVHTTEAFTINLMVGATPVVSMDIADDTYLWFVPGIKGPVVTWVHSTTTTTSGTNQTYSFKWNRPNYTDVTADFQANATTGTTDDTFNLTNLSSPLNGSTFAWNFTPNTVTYMNGTSATSVHPDVKFNAPGLYTADVTITNTSLSGLQTATKTKTSYFDIAAAPALVAGFTSDVQDIAVNGSVNFTSSCVPNATGGTTYQWAVNPPVNFVFSNFTTSVSENPTILFTAGGCYSIQMLATNTGFTNSPVTITQANWVSVGGACDHNVGIKNPSQSSIYVYPNPSEGVFYVNIPNSGSIKIFDIAGKEVYNKFDASGQMKIDLSAATPGMYMIIVIENGKKLSEVINIQ